MRRYFFDRSIPILRATLTLLISLMMLVQTASAFDLEKAKKDYKGAGFAVASIKEILYENAPAIAVSFTAPVDRDLLEDKQIYLKGGRSDHWVVNEDRTKVIFPFVTPKAKYIVNVSNRIKDINGQKLEFSEYKTVTTKALTPGVNFTSSAHIISSSSPRQLPVTTLNVDEVTIDFFRINAKSLPKMMERFGKNGWADYYNLKKLKTYGSLVHTGRFALNPRKNQRTDYNIDLSGIDALSAPGAYVAVMSQPGEYNYQYEHALFMQTDIGLHIREYKGRFDVYTQNIATGNPMANVQVKIINREGKVVDAGESDELGRVSFRAKSSQHQLLATLGDQFSVLRLGRNALDLSGLKNAVTVHSEYQIYPWGPRDLYRPGDNIEVKVLVRDFDGKLPEGLPLSYAFYKPDGSRLTSGQLQPKETGLYGFDYQTSDSSQTGTYTLKLAYAGGNACRYQVKVEEFLPERLDLTLFDGPQEGKRLYASPSYVKLPVASKYLYGAPASGNKVDGFMTAKVDRHPFDHLPTFFFGDKSEKLMVRRRDFGTHSLDEKGKTWLSVGNLWTKQTSPVEVHANVSVYETGGRPVTRSTRLTILNGKRFLGIEPQFSGNPDSDTTVDIKVGVANSAGEWQEARDIQLSLIRQDRNWYWRHSDSRGWHWDWDESPVTVFTKSLTTRKGETTTVSLPLSWGRYRVEITDGTTRTAYGFKTSWSWWGNADTGSAQKPDQVSLGFGKASYVPGETAELRITPPQDGLALVTVESSEKSLYTTYVPVKSEGTVVSIPTNTSWNRHDLYASVMVIRPGDMTATPVPSRAFGMVHLPLKRKGAHLDVSIDAPERTQPNKTVKASISVSAEDGPVSANTRVVVALVDVGILNITRYATPDAEGYFFGARRYTVDLYDNYGEIIDNIGPAAARQRFGGGFAESDAELSRGGDKPKSDVRMVSFFSEPLAVDADGQVTAEFELPDFNGQLRWMVLAYADEQFGKADANTTVADKIVTQVAMPRFLAMGDNSTLALDLRNMSGEPQTFSVKMTQGGSLAASTETRSVSLKEKEKTTLRFPLTAEKSTGQGVISMHLTGPGGDSGEALDIDRIWRLGVRSPYPSISRKTVATIDPNSQWTPTLQTDDLVPASVRFQMNLSDRPPIDFAGHFEYLLHYPYGCLEQSISSGYPWVLATPEGLGELGLTNRVEEQFKRPYDEAFRRAQVDKAVTRVLDCQKSNGSFGLWSSDSPEDEWLTVYAAEFLHDAQKMGIPVGSKALEKADKRLRTYLKGNNASSRHWSEDPDHYRFAYRSYAGYILARNGKARLSDLRRLYSHYDGKTDDDGLSWMYLSAAFKFTGDERHGEASYEKALSERLRSDRRYYGDYGSPVRDLGRMTELAMAYGFEGLGELVEDLADTVRERRWLSTQERICLFRTATKALSGQGDANKEKWQAVLMTQNGDQALSRNRDFSSLFDLDQFQGLTAIKAGEKPIYANVSLTGERKNAPEPVSNEMTITRNFYDVDGNEISPTTLKSGALMVVKLTVSATRRTPDGLVVDLLPAGVEIENQNLGLSSVRLDEIRIGDKPVGKLWDKGAVSHEEFRDDRYVAAVSVGEESTVTLFYLVRAVTPGVYRMPGSYVEDMYRPFRHAIGGTFETLTVTE
ncbi:alpha-2-macroglobulin family protein [Desulfoluna butyratoxydans]|uniref:Terpenoid cyclases/protein prenyltransferase alpha-alpha toroid n=1 Tax=Desulfoluna butyratoxydans TaxID=231438 RepID=A0A4U8YN94_9BACT|nr:MG2 domain-containing protein [Desulfoluna butyratoxydans]VFQ43122.1 terpenoid cyclases/protein prenyltransferase alpha-alpha toroid [Desulfoluna butyratoxydans]